MGYISDPKPFSVLTWPRLEQNLAEKGRKTFWILGDGCLLQKDFRLESWAVGSPSGALVLPAIRLAANTAFPCTIIYHLFASFSYF